MSAIVKTIWMIETHFGLPLTLDELAAQAGVSRSYLSRSFPLPPAGPSRPIPAPAA